MSNIDPSSQPDGGIGSILNAASKNPPSAKSPSGSGSIFKISKGTDHGMDAFKNWLGPKDYKAFISNLLQSINNSIQADQKATDLANRKLRAVETGEDPDEVTE